METGAQQKRGLHTRGLTSFIVTLTFLVLLVTGCVLYASPKGRVAQWTDWTVLGLDKEEWSAVHMVTSLAFIIAVGFHLYFNWRVFLSYFKKKLEAGFHLKREFAIAALVTILIVAGAVFELPPFSFVEQWNSDIKDSWEARSTLGPYPHAEESTLPELCENTGLDLDEALGRLKAAGLEAPDTNASITVLAALNHTTPSRLFAVISPGQAPPAGGAGLGRKSVKQVCADEGLAVETALKALRDKGIEAGPEDSLKDLATKADLTPRAVLEIIQAAPGQ